MTIYCDRHYFASPEDLAEFLSEDESLRKQNLEIEQFYRIPISHEAPLQLGKSHSAQEPLRQPLGPFCRQLAD